MGAAQKHQELSCHKGTQRTQKLEAQAPFLCALSRSFAAKSFSVVSRRARSANYQRSGAWFQFPLEQASQPGTIALFDGTATINISAWFLTVPVNPLFCRADWMMPDPAGNRHAAFERMKEGKASEECWSREWGKKTWGRGIFGRGIGERNSFSRGQPALAESGRGADRDRS